MLIELLIAGSLATYRPEPAKLVNIKPTLNIELIEPIAPIEPVEQKKLPKLNKIAVTPKTVARSAPAGWYPYGQCTWYVWTKRAVGSWHDAITWPSMARAEGWYVGSKPVVGAIGQRGNHVVYVEQVKATTVVISERNYDGYGSFRRIERPISYFTYIY